MPRIGTTGMYLLFKNFSNWLASNIHTGGLIISPWYIRRSFAGQLNRYRCQAAELLGNPPVLIGEFGIAYDMQNKRAYQTGDFRKQIGAMDRMLRALDDTLLSGTIWNYTADNTNARGDGWNDEDLSIFSRDQQRDPKDVNSGGRALEAVARPYARAIAGALLRMGFDYRSRVFECAFRHDARATAPTEIYVPQFPISRRRGGEALRRNVQAESGGPDARIFPHNRPRDPYRSDPAEVRWICKRINRFLEA